MIHLRLQCSEAVGWNVKNASFYILSLGTPRIPVQVAKHPALTGELRTRPRNGGFRGDVTLSSRNTKGTWLGSPANSSRPQSRQAQSRPIPAADAAQGYGQG